MNILDAIIVVVLILGVLSGIKRGVLKTTISLIGTVVIMVIAFYLKNPVSEILYKNLPFFEIKGLLQGVSSINILIYELIAFLVVFAILYIVLKIILKITGLIEKVMKLTVVLGFFSSIGGAIVGLVEGYLLCFVALFIINMPFFTIIGMSDSTLGNKILYNTPVLSAKTENINKVVDEIYELGTEYKNNKILYNQKAVELLIKYEVIDQENVNILKEKGKLNY